MYCPSSGASSSYSNSNFVATCSFSFALRGFFFGERIQRTRVFICLVKQKAGSVLESTGFETNCRLQATRYVEKSRVNIPQVIHSVRDELWAVTLIRPAKSVRSDNVLTRREANELYTVSVEKSSVAGEFSGSFLETLGHGTRVT